MKDRNEASLIVIMLVVVACLVAMAFRIGAVFGHEGDDSLSSWYRSLQTVSGTSCCSRTDCSPVDSKIEGDHWYARINNEWRVVPDEIILKRDNPAGDAVACVFQGEFRCFVLPQAS